MYTIDVPKKEQPYCLSGLVRSVSWFFNIETNKNLQNTAVSHVVYFLLEWRRSKWQRVGGETAGFMFLLSVILPISCPPAVICSVLCCSLCSLSCHCVCCHSPVSPCLSSVLLRQWSMDSLTSPALWATVPPCSCWPSAPALGPSNCILHCTCVSIVAREESERHVWTWGSVN